ncbi:MAG: LPXTG cell wall anchor domain-containing protein [Oscillospiraceae bacterium]|nr:LPXTG cell wall anchor domain-containing protein [Oscillospiraceae bacterium]
MDESTITVIEGDYTLDNLDTVAINTYSLTDAIISGYGILPASEEISSEAEASTEETETGPDTNTETEETELVIESTYYTASDGGVTVTVVAPSGALPDNAVLSVNLLDEESDEYASAAEAVGYDSASEESGMAALDIAFYDQYGNEVEPSVAVTVSVDIASIIPDGTTAETLEVSHITETEVGTETVTTVTAVETITETVTDSTDETAVVVFETESFSTFTLTWSVTILFTHTETIDVNVYDVDTGDLIPATSISNISNTFDSGVDAYLDSICTVDGYEYQYATVTYTADGQSYTVQLDTIVCSYNWLFGTWSYEIDGSNINGRNVSISNINLYFKQSAVVTTAELIVNKYATGGSTQLSGAVFELTSLSSVSLTDVTVGNGVDVSYSSDGYTVTFTTDGSAITLTGLPAGSYTLKETTAPTNYYVATDFEFTVSGGAITDYDSRYDSTTNAVTIYDTEKTAGLTIYKYETGGSTQLEDATFKLVSDVSLSNVTSSTGYIRNTDEYTITFTTTDTALTFDNLPNGSYTLTETWAPTGYDTADPITFTVSEGEVYLDGSTVATDSIIVYDEMLTYELNVSKSYASSNGNAITVGVDDLEAEFTLKSVDNTNTPDYEETIVITGASTGVFEGLAYNGTYTLSETTVPTGYTTPADITITVVNGVIYVDDAEIDTAYVTNVDTNHTLNGMSYAIANLNSARDYALTAEVISTGGMNADSVTVVGTDTDGTTIIYGTDTIWTFEAVSGKDDVYYVYTTVGDTTYYLNITRNSTVKSGLSVSTTAQEISVIEGTGTYEGQYRLSYDSSSYSSCVNWYGGSNASNLIFGAWNAYENNDYQYLCRVVDTNGSLLLYDLNLGGDVSLDTTSGSGWYTSSYDSTTDSWTWTATSGTDYNPPDTSTIQVASTGSTLYEVLGKGENGYYTYVSGQRLSIAQQLIADGKSPGKEFRFDGWTATVDNVTYTFAAGAEIVDIDSNGYIYIYDTSGNLVALPSGTKLTAQWTEISDIVMFFVNYSGTVLDVEGDVTGRNQKEFTGIISIGHVYFGTTRVGSDSTFASDADATIREDFAYTVNYNDEIVQIVIEYVTINGQGIYNLAEGINDSILDDYLLEYIRESGITIKISAADGTNPAIENENATTDNYTVRWYVLKEQVDGWHVDGVMVAITAEMTITKTFSGLSDSEVESILEVYNMPLTVGVDSKTGERQEYVTIYAADPVSTDNVTANGVYEYEGQVGSTQSYRWVLNAITNEEYTLTEEDYELSGYNVATLAVLYYTDEYGNEQYVSGWTTTSDDLSEVITGGTTTAFSFNNFYTPIETGILAIIKTDENGSTLSGAEFTLTDSGGNETTVSSNVNGLALFNDLSPGTYTLVETLAPDGYQLNDTVWRVVVAEDSSSNVTVTVYASTDGGLTYDTGAVYYDSSTESMQYLTVTDEVANETVVITKNFGGELTYAQMQVIYDASTSSNDYATNANSTYTRLPYYIELEDSNGNTQILYLESATRSQTGFTYTWTLSGIDAGDWTIAEYNYIYDVYIDTTVTATVDGADGTVSVNGTGMSRIASFGAEFTDSESNSVVISNVYTNYFTLSILKVDSISGEVLDGATFDVYGSYAESTDVDNNFTYTDGNGIDRTVYYIGTITTDTNGIATISGLKLSNDDNSYEYVLVETEAPTGYTASTEQTYITVYVDSSGYNTGVYTIEIANVPDSIIVMPQTGDRGTKLYTMAGLLLICSAGYLMYRKQKRKCKWRWNI